MKIIIPVGEDRKGVCPSFGRAPYFSVRDSDTGTETLVENSAADSEGGAGIRAAQAALDLGAEAIITPRLGENAANIFRQAGVRMYAPIAGGARENADALWAGALKPLTAIHPGYHGRAR